MKALVGGFYEDDEPIDELLVSFEMGEPGVTAAPTTTGTTLVLTLE